MFNTLLDATIQLLKIPFMIIGSVSVAFIFSCSLHIIWGLIKGKRFKRGAHKKVKKHSLVRRLFFDLPKQYVADMFDRDPEFFRYQGLIIYEGRQGSGKTSTMVHDTLMMQHEYPKCKIITNLDYKHQNDELTHWRKLVHYKNGIKGVVAVMDELQNWFSSNQSKNFPPEMLQTITQNRKNRRIILGTAQSFYMLSKAIRSQTTEVRKCHTFLGCMTIVQRRIPILNSDGDVQEWKNHGFYMYIHDKELRDSFDTYKVIESLVKAGFKETASNIDNKVVNYNVISKKDLRK